MIEAISSNIIYILTALIIILIGLVIRMEIRTKRLLRGNKVNNLEETIISVLKDIEILDDSRKIAEEEIIKIKQDLRKKIHASGAVRFNPFKDVGGNQSFATSFISEEGNGVIMSSLYSRDKVCVYAKPVKNFKPEYELSAEEKEALENVFRK